MDHLPGRERQVAPRSKNLRVNHAQASGADIGHEVAGAGRDAGSAGLNRLLKGSGVRHEHQARAHGVDELAEMESDVLTLSLVHVVGTALLQEPVRREKVDVLESAIDGICMPLRSSEPLVGQL